MDQADHAGVCADIVVDEMYPNMRQGVATVSATETASVSAQKPRALRAFVSTLLARALRCHKADWQMVHDRLVCNDTLAQLADRYGITAQIKTSADAQHIKQHIVKIRGSAFEAWVAGVYYDWLLLYGGPPVSIPRVHGPRQRADCSVSRLVRVMRFPSLSRSQQSSAPSRCHRLRNPSPGPMRTTPTTRPPNPASTYGVCSPPARPHQSGLTPVPRQALHEATAAPSTTCSRGSGQCTCQSSSSH